MNNLQSFIDAAITKLSESSSDRPSRFAKIVQATNHSDPANRIALTVVALQTQRTEAKLKENATGVPQDGPEVAPEYALSFIQEVMNTVCWNARRLHMSIAGSEDMANGIDFSQDVGDQVGVYTEHVAPQVTEDFLTLRNLHTWIAGRMSYLSDIRPLAYFARSAPVEHEDGTTTWELEYEHQSFEDAMGEMDTIIATLQAEAAEAQLSEASSLDFSAPGPVNDKDLQRTEERREIAAEQNAIIADAREAIREDRIDEEADALQERWATATA